MKRSLITILFIISVVAVSSNATVQEGDNEFDFSASWVQENYDNDDSWDSFSLGATLGHFFSDEMELGIGLSGSWSDYSDLYGIGGNIKYHFSPQNQIIPYVGAQVNYYTEEADYDDDDGIMWGPLAGLKIFVTGTENVFVVVEYQYQMYEGDLGDYYDAGHQIVVGLGFKF